MDVGRIVVARLARGMEIASSLFSPGRDSLAPHRCVSVCSMPHPGQTFALSRNVP
jgi:hypothetical protein